MPFTTRSTEEICFMQRFDWVNHFTINKRTLQNTIKILSTIHSFNITDENHYKYHLQLFPFPSSPSYANVLTEQNFH